MTAPEPSTATGYANVKGLLTVCTAITATAPRAGYGQVEALADAFLLLNKAGGHSSDFCDELLPGAAHLL